MYTKSFFKKIDHYLAIAELTIIEDILLENIYKLKTKNEKWYYFNRLNVPIKIRKQGIATELMKELIEWADKEKINIILDINPYGTMPYQKLKLFYKKFGFKTKNEIFLRFHN